MKLISVHIFFEKKFMVKKVQIINSYKFCLRCFVDKVTV